VDLLLKAGSRPYEGSALVTAAETGNLETIKQLLAAGGPVPAELATEALQHASLYERYTVLEFLLEQGLKAGKQDSGNGRAPLLFSVLRENEIPSAEILLKHGVDINEMAEPGPSPIFRIRISESLRCMSRLRVRRLELSKSWKNCWPPVPTRTACLRIGMRKMNGLNK